MAKVYYGSIGAAAKGDGSRENPYSTYSEALAASTTADEMVAIGPLAYSAAGEIVASVQRSWIADSYRGSTLIAPNDETIYPIRTSGSLTVAGNPHIIADLNLKSIRLDGDPTTNAIQMSGNSGLDLEFQVNNVHAISYQSTRLFYCNPQRGRKDINNLSLSGDIPAGTGQYFFANAQATSGDDVLNINQMDLVPGVEQNGNSAIMVDIDGVNNATNSFDCHIKGFYADITFGEATSANFIVDAVGAKTTFVFTDFDISARAKGNSVGITAVQISGGSSSNLADAEISNGLVIYEGTAGAAISYGISTTDSHITNGRVSGCTVVGKAYATATPHNFIFGQGTAGNHSGNISIGGHVGYLVSITDAGTVVSGNMAYNNDGPSYYAKGTVAATIHSNVAIHTNATTNRSNAVLSCVSQGATNTAAADFIDNLVIVEDVSRIAALAEKEASQVCTFQNNVYIIPDTVDLATADLFKYESTSANNTLAEWLAQSEVTNDIIVQMPQEEIKKLIKRKTRRFDSAIALAS